MIYVLPNIPESLSRAICADLIGKLPSPTDDTPEQRALRDERAITALAHYIPENAAEAELAADIVAAEFHAKDALRGALHFANDPAAAERCCRQHALMMRTMHGGLRALLRMQAERHKAEDANRPAALLRAGFLHSGTLTREPEPPPCQPGAVPEPRPAAMPKYEDMTEAEQYAVIYPDRASAIRRHGGMPPGAGYPPPDDAVFKEIVTGNSPVFLALDAEVAAGAVTKHETPSHSTALRDNDGTAKAASQYITSPPFGDSVAPT
jgi:hypothetical protein